MTDQPVTAIVPNRCSGLHCASTDPTHDLDHGVIDRLAVENARLRAALRDLLVATGEYSYGGTPEFSDAIDAAEEALGPVDSGS